MGTMVGTTLLFVYGTLMRGFRLHDLLSQAKFRGEATVAGRLCDLGLFPALSLDGVGRVQGEVYEVDAPTLRIIDRVEGYDAHCHSGPYLREPVEVLSTDGKLLAVQVYAANMNLAGRPQIETGAIADYRLWVDRHPCPHVGMELRTTRKRFQTRGKATHA
jgi:gamma-glutamylcyclotransferase (GGCT)/AIG2-like uncharacterized protein YtfP